MFPSDLVLVMVGSITLLITSAQAGVILIRIGDGILVLVILIPVGDGTMVGVHLTMDGIIHGTIRAVIVTVTMTGIMADILPITIPIPIMVPENPCIGLMEVGMH